MKKARLLVCLFVLAIVIQAPTIASASPLVAQPIDGTTVTPTNMVSTLVGSGVAFSNVNYGGADAASGKFSGGAGVIGFDSGILLTSGWATNVQAPNNSDDATAVNGTPGDDDLEAIQGVGTGNSHDAALLEFDFTPNATPIFFNFVFASEEYNEFANTQYNDVFAFLVGDVNKTNCAKVPNTAQPVSVNNVNGGNPLGTSPQNPQYFINNDPSDLPNAGLATQMDGLTTVLTCRADVIPNSTNHVKLAIADTGDSSLDSAVFLEAGSFTTTPPDRTLSVSTTGGGSGNVSSDPAGINCPGGEACSSQFPDGTDVTLTATPAEGSDFVSWTGCDSTDGTICNVTMNADKSVTATFVVQQNTLTVTNPGSGSGAITFSYDETSSSCALTASTSCSKAFDPGTVVTLSASAASGSTFAGWSGEGCSGAGTCAVTMSANKSVTAIFNQNSTGDAASGFVPPGGTIQTCQSTSSTDNTCSAITLPSGGPGATITITEQAGSTSTICNGPCSNQTTFYSITCTPATPCYTNTKSPVKVILRYKTPGTSTKADMYFLHSSSSTAFKIPDCLKNGIAKPNPCVTARKRLGIGNNDLQVQVLVTSDDPIIGKR